jgi:hypothetical protein
VSFREFIEFLDALNDIFSSEAAREGELVWTSLQRANLPTRGIFHLGRWLARHSPCTVEAISLRTAIRFLEDLGRYCLGP